LIDNGTTVTIISFDAYNKIDKEQQPKIEPFISPVHDASGRIIKTIGTTILTIELYGHFFEQSVFICDIDHDGILGKDFL
jgi:hypothetical protein